MPRSPTKPPKESIVDLGTDRVSFEAGDFLVQVLRRDWNPANTNGMTPDIETAERTKAIIFRTDWIILSLIDIQEEPATLGYQHVNVTYNFQLDFYSAQDRVHFLRFVEEARRVILKNRKGTVDTERDVTGATWMKWKSSKSFDRNLSNMYRMSVDVELRWRFRRVEV